jgi:N12 class adenine-specific DNA methylase
MISELKKLYRSSQEINLKSNEIFQNITEACRDAASNGKESVEIKITSSANVISRILGLISFAELVILRTDILTESVDGTKDTVRLIVGGWSEVSLTEKHRIMINDVKECELNQVAFNKKVSELGITPKPTESEKISNSEAEKTVDEILNSLESITNSLGLKMDSKKMKSDAAKVHGDWARAIQSLNFMTGK